MSVESDSIPVRDSGNGSPPARPARPRTILLAEDEESVRSFVRAVLEHAGFELAIATDGRAAIELFNSDPSRFDLVLTDVIMPHALGTELAARVRKLRPGVPVLFMSAFPGGAGVAPDPLPVGENLLEKPFTVAILLEAVHRTLGDARP